MDSTTTATFRCLGGRPLAEEILRGLARYGALPEDARAAFPALLLPSLDAELGAGVEKAATSFCERFAVSLAHVAAVASGLRVVLRGAALHGLSEEELRVDLEPVAAAMGPEAGAWVAAALAIYPVARARVARRAFDDAVQSMGRTVVDLDWRLDVVAGSRDAPGIRGPVVHIAMTVALEGKRETLHVQLPPAMVEALRAMCDAARPRA